jgi:hypothetical protein
MPHLTGLKRNYVQCIKDFNIPIEFSTTVKRIIGKLRVEAVEIVKVDENFNYISGTEETVNCDTLLLSIGLIPENELSRKAGILLDPLTNGPVINDYMETNIPGIFSAGNVTTIYDLVDYVTIAGFSAGKNAALFALEKYDNFNFINLKPGNLIKSLIPQKIVKNLFEKDFNLQFRAGKEIHDNVSLEIKAENRTIYTHNLKYVRPAEMVNIKINKEELFKNTGVSTDLTVNLMVNK